jgi:hypothetical protein
MINAVQAAYNEASAALTVAHAEVRALTVNKSKTVADVSAVYDRLAVVKAAFNTAKDALDAVERVTS